MSSNQIGVTTSPRGRLKLEILFELRNQEKETVASTVTQMEI